MSGQRCLFGAPDGPEVRPGQPCPCCGRVVPALGSLDAEPLSHRDGPATERVAAAIAWPGARAGNRRVLEALLAAGDHGATFDELIVSLGMYSAQKRLHDVKRAGWAVGTGRVRDTRTGTPAEVYVLSDHARARLVGGRS